MLTLRPMTEADVAGAVAAFDSGFLAMRARYGLSGQRPTRSQNERRRQNRTRHFLWPPIPAARGWPTTTGTIVGMSQSIVREGYWMLSQLGTMPGRQGRGLGRELLRLALSHGDPDSPGTIQCSRDPKAMALYSELRLLAPSGRGRLGTRAARRGDPPADVTRHEPTRGHRGPARHRDGHRPRGPRLGPHRRHRDDAVRGGHPAAAARRPGLRRGQGRAHRHPRAPQRGVGRAGPAHHAGRGPARARRSRSTGSPRPSSGPSACSPRPASNSQPYGPVMVRGMPGPPSPYIPSGGYG